MITRPLFLRSPDGDGGGAAAVAAPAAPAAPVTPGPKPFVVDAHPKHASFRAALEANSPNPPKPSQNPPKPPAAAAKPAEANVEPTKPADAPKPGEKPAEAVPAADGKAKPAQEGWKELKASRASERQRADAAEAKLRDYETQRVPEQERSGLTARMEAIQKRNEELENEIRFVNYEKSKEFMEKHHQPYVDALSTAMHDLSRIPVVDAATGQQRAATEEDLFALMSLDPVRQIEAAEAMFGEKLAQRVINHADKVRDVLTARNKSLEEARVNGKTREQEMQTRTQAQQKAFQQEVVKWANTAVEEWNKDPDAAQFDLIKPREDGKGLTPDEQEHNALVTKGIELAKLLEKKPQHCKTKDEAQALIRKQVAVVKRAVHFGAVRRLLKLERKAHAATKAALSKYEATAPPTGGGRQASGTAQPTPFRSSIRSSLERHSGRRM